jgi:flagellar hook-associated protein 1 FlgK
MSSLFSSLTSAARALDAQRFGLDVTGQNIANVNTPGYTRRTIDMAAVPPESNRTAGRGVDVVAVRAARDLLIERRLQQELPSERREAAVADVLSVVEVALGKPGESIDGAFDRFFDAFAALSQNPSSPVARQEVLLQAESLADAFHDMEERIALAQRDTDLQVSSAVQDVNELTARIAKLNDTIGRTGESAGGILHLQDEQSVLVRQLSEIVDVDVLQRADGGVDITIGNGRALVIGKNQYAIASSVVAGVSHIFSAAGVDITSEIGAGKVGGLIHARDVLLPGYRANLDTLAHEFVTQVNTLHAAGVGADGGTGRNLFTFSPAIVGTAGAASAIAVDAAVAADTDLVAAAGPGAPVGDNATARGLAALRHTRVFGGSATLHDTWGQLVYRVGRDTQAARNEQKSREEIVDQVDALRDQVSGVSLDEEAVNLLKYQKAYEANARFFRAIDTTLDTLLGILR